MRPCCVETRLAERPKLLARLVTTTGDSARGGGVGAATEPAVLTALGLSEMEARVYLAVVDYPASTATDLVHRTGISSRLVRRSLAGLVSKKLVLRTISRYRRYRITPPELAFMEMLSTRIEQLERARALAEALIRRESA